MCVQFNTCVVLDFFVRITNIVNKKGQNWQMWPWPKKFSIIMFSKAKKNWKFDEEILRNVKSFCDGHADGRTVRQTDRQTDKAIPMYCLFLQNGDMKMIMVVLNLHYCHCAKHSKYFLYHGTTINVIYIPDINKPATNDE